MMASTAKVAIVVLLALGALGAAVAAVLVATAPAEVDSEDLRSPDAIESWCGDVGEAFTDGEPFRSFAQVAEAAIDGDLDRPTEDPPVHDEAGLERWQRAHAGYLTSSYLSLFDTDPYPVVWHGLHLRSALAAAHDGRPIDDPEVVTDAATALDRFRADRC
jgi:hypothetical protein